MATDLFDQLAIGDVPPPPPQFERRVHERVNRNLLLQQTLDFVVGAGPWLALQLWSAAWALLYYTLMGRYPSRGGGNPSPGEQNSAP